MRGMSSDKEFGQSERLPSPKQDIPVSPKIASKGQELNKDLAVMRINQTAETVTRKKYSITKTISKSLAEENEEGTGI